LLNEVEVGTRSNKLQGLKDVFAHGTFEDTIDENGDILSEEFI
jgi:hypothetical protein